MKLTKRNALVALLALTSMSGAMAQSTYTDKDLEKAIKDVYAILGEGMTMNGTTLHVKGDTLVEQLHCGREDFETVKKSSEFVSLKCDRTLMLHPSLHNLAQDKKMLEIAVALGKWYIYEYANTEYSETIRIVLTPQEFADAVAGRTKENTDY